MDDSMLASFHKDLDRSAHLLRLTKEFRDFAGTPVPADFLNNTAAWESAKDLHQLAALVRTDLPIFAGSIQLYVCGRFEHFVRQLIVAIADEVAASCTDYASLPVVIRSELRQRTLEVAQNPARYGYTDSSAESLIITLSKSLMPPEAGAPIQIASDILAVTENNMHSRTLVEVFRRVNIASIWPEIGSQASMKVYLNKSADGECTKEAMAKLDKLMKDRNGMAHPTGETNFPDADKVLGAVEYFRVLSRVLVDLARIPRT